MKTLELEGNEPEQQAVVKKVKKGVSLSDLELDFSRPTTELGEEQLQTPNSIPRHAVEQVRSTSIPPFLPTCRPQHRLPPPNLASCHANHDAASLMNHSA